VLSVDASIRISAKERFGWQRDILAGLSAACIVLPFGIAAGVLVFSPLGVSFAAQGAAVGLYTAIIAGAVVAIAASSSFSITCPNISTSIIPAGFAAYLMTKNEFTHDLSLVVVAIVLCILLAGLLQIAFGLFGIARVIKFTPHSVLAGFINSVGLIVAISQLRPFFVFDSNTFGLVRFERPPELLFMLALAAGILVIANQIKKLPAPFVGLVGGTLLFHAMHAIAPELALGPTIGALPTTFLSAPSLVKLADASVRAALLSVSSPLLLTSLTLAVVATLQALLAFRMIQTLADLPPHPRRDVIAQGIANIASSVVGGISAVPAPSAINASFRAGGRTRIVGLSAAATIFILIVFFSSVLAQIPVIVLNAVLLTVAVQIFDPWTFRTLRDAFVPRPGVDRRHAWQNLAVIALVMIASVGSSIIAGAVAGFGLACLIFIANMSKPIVRRRFFGDEIFSKRIRSSEEMGILLGIGRRRAVLQLEGVLFFGNADNLSNVVNELLKVTDMVLLDLRGISDIDVSGVTILVNLLARARALGKVVALCNVPTIRFDFMGLGTDAIILADLDSGLEWMEERALHSAKSRPRDQAIPLCELEAMREFQSDEIAEFESMITAREFAAGDIICSENDDADRMWLLTKGTVSVWLKVENGRRRIASLAAGTTVGEMALLQESVRRSATVSANEDVSAYELSRTTFESILNERPAIGLKLLKYFTREMARRLRLSDQDLRANE